MISRIILVCGEVEGPHLAGLLKDQNPTLEVDRASDGDTLEKLSHAVTPTTRLIAFCTSVIVPAEVLKRFSGPSYNFHPGPPEIPGRYPSVWAIYNGEKRFGITVHEMRASVDSGPIVYADRFDIQPFLDLEALDTLAFERIIRAFHTLAPHLANEPSPLPHIDEQWTGRKYTRADCLELCAVGPDVSDDERALRRRACGIHFKELAG